MVILISPCIIRTKQVAGCKTPTKSYVGWWVQFLHRLLRAIGMVEKRRDYRTIANRLIRTLPEFEYLRDSGVRIAYLASDEEKKKDRKLVLADCYKVNEKRYGFCVPYDFFITVYLPNVVTLSDAQLETLIRHELHHVGIDTESNEGGFYVVPHDVEEFWDIIDDLGVDWQR